VAPAAPKSPAIAEGAAEVLPEQPQPLRGREDVTEALVAAIRARQAKGIATYGDTLRTHNGRDAGRDLVEELLDGAQYAMQMRLERRDLEGRIATLEALLLEAREEVVRVGDEGMGWRIEAERLRRVARKTQRKPRSEA
jgi:hypothetical protein